MPALMRLIGLAVLTLGPSVAHAAATCMISALPLSFGTYDHLEPFPADSQSTVTMSCRETALIGLGDTVNYDISLDGGSAANTADRTLVQGADTLHYNLYSELTRTLIWGEGGQAVSGVLAVPLCVLGLGCVTVSAPHIVYGRLPAGQSVPAGSYSDTITVTVTY